MEQQTPLHLTKPSKKVKLQDEKIGLILGLALERNELTLQEELLLTTCNKELYNERKYINYYYGNISHWIFWNDFNAKSFGYYIYTLDILLEKLNVYILKLSLHDLCSEKKKISEGNIKKYDDWKKHTVKKCMYEHTLSHFEDFGWSKYDKENIISTIMTMTKYRLLQTEDTEVEIIHNFDDMYDKECEEYKEIKTHPFFKYFSRIITLRNYNEIN